MIERELNRVEIHIRDVGLEMVRLVAMRLFAKFDDESCPEASRRVGSLCLDDDVAGQETGDGLIPEFRQLGHEPGGNVVNGRLACLRPITPSIARTSQDSKDKPSSGPSAATATASSGP